MQASPGHRLHHTGVPKLLQVTTGGTPGPHRSHKRGFPHFLVTHAKGVFFTHAKIPPSTLEWTFPEHSILVDSALRKETPISPGRAKGILSILLLIYYSRHQLIDAGSRSEEHTSELQSHHDLVCRLL